jgi:hypothetical protein
VGYNPVRGIPQNNLLSDGFTVGLKRERLPAQEIRTQEETMNARLMGSVFRLRQLAAEFNHFWAYAIPTETLAEIWTKSSNFTEFKKNLGETCARMNISPIGGKYLEDAHFEKGWLTAYFGRNQQIKVSIDPDRMLFRVEYTNGQRWCSVVYNNTSGELTWESSPQTPRDAVRVLRVLSVLAECDHKLFITTHLPKELEGEEAELYQRTTFWAHLWINPEDLKDILSVR